jgi:mRNA interferase RelE/StbE
MVYSLSFSRQAFKELEKIKEPFYSAIKQAILHLTIEPRPKGCKKLKGRDSYRIRTGDYRIIYKIIDNLLIVEIITIGHRKEIYR